MVMDPGILSLDDMPSLAKAEFVFGVDRDAASAATKHSLEHFVVMYQEISR
jgi:hypothetical protein